jgi:hypothetical protein
MKTKILSLLLPFAFFYGSGTVWSEEFPKFEYHEIARIGNHMGQTSLVDVDKDGKLDWIVGCSHGDVWWFRYESPDRWIRRTIGAGAGTEVGGTAFDVDGDGWVDQVSGSTWFRNPGRLGGREWAKHSNGAISNSHDVVAADVDGDGDLDVVCSTGWYENVDGKGREWKWHGNIDGGHGGRFKDATRVWVVDLDKDGHNDVVMTDCDTEIGPRRVHWFRNKDGKGGQWEHHVIATGKGDLHTLAVGDFNNDGRLDVFSGEGPLRGSGPGGKRRWFIWENPDGRGTSWKEHMILEGPECHEGVAGDVEGDGDLDICSKAWNGNLHVHLRNMLADLEKHSDIRQRLKVK